MKINYSKIYEKLVDEDEELINKAALQKDKISHDKTLKECCLVGNPIHNKDYVKLQIYIQKSKSKDNYESKQFIAFKEIDGKINEQKKLNKHKLKNIDRINTIDELKDEYYKRIDIIMESNNTLSIKLSDANDIKVFEIKEKLNLLQNKR